jgi:hypothetical protein
MWMRRRDFLALGAAGTAGLAAPQWARAIGDSSKFRIGRVDLGESSNPRPSALRRIAWEVDKRTSIDVDTQERTVSLGDKKLHETPFLYLAGDREFAMPTPQEIDALRVFLTFGGFLLIDSAEGSTDGAFDGAVRQLVETLYPLPEQGFALIPKDHVVYKSFYLIDRPLGRLALSGAMEGVFRDERLIIAYTQNDLGGAWARDNFGNYEHECDPDGERQRETSFRLGVNLVMYALCLDYKTDQVHVPFIMRRRRWRPDDGAEEP